MPRTPGARNLLTIATCQFPVDADIRRNARFIMRQMERAKTLGADIAHFPEGALSGYAGSDFKSFDGFDWDLLEECTRGIVELTRELAIWTVLGSAHRLSGGHKPHNSLYAIDDHGRLVERYDKRFCSGGDDGVSGDLAHYSPGDHLSVFTVHGVRCGAQICYDYRFPELYRAYAREGVKLMFHSFHAAHASRAWLVESRKAIGENLPGVLAGSTLTYPGITMPAAMTAAAANNYMWISCPNSSARESAWPSFFVRADGVTTGRLRRNVAGVLISEVVTSEDLYDSTFRWRDRAMNNVLHSGTIVEDPRSENRSGW